MSDDPTLQEDFELGGRFWLPQAPKQALHGRLRYADGRVMLKLLGVFSSAPAGALTDDAEFILGSTERGPCTLWRSWRSQANTTILGGEVEPYTSGSTWSANRLFMGAHFVDVDGMLLSESRFAFQQLPAWLARAPFDVDFTGGVVSARYEFLNDIVVPLASQNATLRIDAGLTQSGNVFEELTLKQPVEVAMEVEEPRPYEWHHDRLGDLRALLGLLVGEAVMPTRFRGVTADRCPVTVFFSLTGEPSERSVHPAEMIFPYPLVADRFREIAERWFALQAHLSVVVSLFFGTLYARGLPREFRFLALTQALETYHRRRHPGLYVTETEYEPVRETLTDAIPAGIESSLRQALTNRLEYGNEFALRRRLTDLLASLTGSSDAVTDDPKMFVEAVVDERNYLTHYPPGEPEPMSALECVHSSVRLRAFLTLLLLAEVGLTGQEAAEGVRRARWHAYVT
jgi:ApeA-like protein/HEPN superfamily Apea-like protein